MHSLLKVNVIFVLLLAGSFFLGTDKFLALAVFLSAVTLIMLFNRFSKSGKELSIKKANSLFAFSLLFLAFLLWKVLSYIYSNNFIVHDPLNMRIASASAGLVFVFYGLYAVRVLSAFSDESKERGDNSAVLEANELSIVYRFLIYLSSWQLFFGLVFIWMYYKDAENSGLMDAIYDWSIFLPLAYLLLILSELFSELFRKWQDYRKTGEIISFRASFFISAIARDTTPVKSLVSAFEGISGLNLANSSLIKYLFKITEPSVLTALLALALLSSVVIVPPEQEVIVRTLGKISSGASIKPGLSFKLPWPLAKAEFYEPLKMKVMNIGFTPDPDAKHILWSKAHAAQTFNLLTGNGVELLSVDCQVLYRIGDLYKYVTSYGNPEAMLEASMYRLMTEIVSASSFDRIVSEDRAEFSQYLKDAAQRISDESGLGFDIAEVLILTIHPPLEISDAYEDVISSQIDKETYIMTAETENTHKMRMNEAFAQNTLDVAQAYAYEGVSGAYGEAAAFRSRYEGFNHNPELEKFRLRTDLLQKLLANKTLYILDGSLTDGKNRFILDWNK
ncbi:MAG: hypothetical protein GX221_01705 [Candidatus Riflebacteria bacterium]|nr:hypothetical protein [Candidatus Riflebacteria bacterium]